MCQNIISKFYSEYFDNLDKINICAIILIFFICCIIVVCYGLTVCFLTPPDQVDNVELSALLTVQAFFRVHPSMLHPFQACTTPETWLETKIHCTVRVHCTRAHSVAVPCKLGGGNSPQKRFPPPTF